MSCASSNWCSSSLAEPAAILKNLGELLFSIAAASFRRIGRRYKYDVTELGRRAILMGLTPR